MKLFAVLLTIAAGYYFVLTSMADMAIGQVQALHGQYQAVADQADQIAAGKTYK